MTSHQIIIRIAGNQDVQHINAIMTEIETSAKNRGTGICKRSAQQLEERMKDGDAVIALSNSGEWIGFCYINSWDNDQFVSTCALVVEPRYRKSKVATYLKQRAFQLARRKYPQAKLFGLTTSLAVMKINTALGFRPVTYSEITKNESFWDACKSCPNYNILRGKRHSNCLCTAMLFDALATIESSCDQSVKQKQDETSFQKKAKKVEAVSVWQSIFALRSFKYLSRKV